MWMKRISMVKGPLELRIRTGHVCSRTSHNGNGSLRAPKGDDGDVEEGD
jgi:hypothetical protein